MAATASPISRDAFDVIVLGAGAGGMTAATVAASQGLRTLLIERSASVGGTTAYSSGTTWVPGSHHLGNDAGHDTAAAREYLQALIGARANAALLDAFLREGPRMVRYLEDLGAARFRPYAVQPDYRQELPGATMGGRALEPLAFDGRQLERHFAEVRAPIPELTLLGGMMITRGEAATLLRGPASPQAIRLALRLLSRHALDRLRHARGTRLVLGNALVARLYRSLLDTGATVWLDTEVKRLMRDGDGRITGVEAILAAPTKGGPAASRHSGNQAGARIVEARRGVVLAGGGFPASPEWRERHLPKPTPPFTPACPDCRGETIQLGLDAGASMGPGSADNALWFPSSSAPRADGSTAVYPHIVLDRAKPGLIAVNAQGNRYGNEAVSYHEFTRALYRAHAESPAIPTWLICDHRFLWKYGLGMIRPRTRRTASWESRGYLKTGATLGELARQLGIPPGRLEETVARHNGFAATGRDLDFHKGETAYEQANGDPEHGPNPCIGRIEHGPFHAVAVHPTPLGTSHGLAVDGQARVLDAAGQPIAGLHACGNDVDSVFGGEYPGPGAQIGPAMTFGYIAARHLAAVAASSGERNQESTGNAA